jgi:Universal stress protein family
LLATAHDENAGLLVISTGGLGTASPVLLGGTACALMRRSPCPVVVVPTRSVPPFDGESFRQVVWAIEGRPSDAAVLDLAADLAARLGSDLHAVIARDDVGEQDIGVAAAVHVARSRTDEAIRRAADEERAGLAVVGPPENSGPSSWLNVPSTIALAATADIPVVVLTGATELHNASGHYQLAASLA